MEFKKRIVLTSIIAGVLPASYLVSRYSKSEKLKDNRSGIIFLGFVLSIVSYILAIVLFETLFVPLSVHKLSPSIKYSLSFVLLVLVQSIIAAVLTFSYERRYGNDVFASNTNFNSKADKINFLAYFLLGLFITAYLFWAGAFRFIFSSIYFIPNVYLYSHLKPLFRSRKQQVPFTLFFILLVLLFPLSLSFSGYLELTFIQIITYVGNYYSILLLYLFLSYIAFDVIRFVYEKFTTSKIRKPVHLRIVFLILFVFAVLVEIKGVINFNTPTVQKFEIDVPRKSASIAQLKIAMAADFHFSEITSAKFVKKFVDEINRLKPDIVVLAGDIFESNNSNEKIDFIKNELSKIQSKYGVYAAEGNHGYYNSTNTQEFYNKTNITLLRDSVLLIDDSFILLGRMDRHNKNRSSITELLLKAKHDLPIITIDHQPYYEDTNKNSTDVYLSGHTHNGQLFPFNFIVKMIFELPWGHKKINSTHFFVTSGAQGWGPQVKTASKSEIMEIDVSFTNN